MGSSQTAGSFWRALGGIFPPPVYLSLRASGVDISNSSIKVLAFGSGSNRDYVRFFDSIPLSEEVIDNGDVLDKKALIEALSALKAKHNMLFVNAALPEKRAFIFQTNLPRSISHEEARVVLESKLEEHVPLAPSEALFDFEFVPGVFSGDGALASVSVYARRVVEDYLEVFNAVGLVPLACEVESQAIARSVISKGDNRTVLIVDFGKTSTKFAVATQGVIMYSSTVDIGGHALTQAVMKHFNVTAEEADHIKNEQGFYQQTNDKGLGEAMMGTVGALTEEIKKRFTYWQDRKEHGESFATPIEKVILCGGNANLRGFPEFLQQALETPVERAEVWTNTTILKEGVPPIDRAHSLEYASVIGLALRNFHD